MWPNLFWMTASAAQTPVAGPEMRFVGGGRSAALQVTERDRAGLEARALLELAGHGFADLPGLQDAFLKLSNWASAESVQRPVPSLTTCGATSMPEIFEPSVTTTMLCDLPVARTRLRTSQISWMSTGFSGTAM
jgi:hypothetical protein